MGGTFATMLKSSRQTRNMSTPLENTTVLPRQIPMPKIPIIPFIILILTANARRIRCTTVLTSSTVSSLPHSHFRTCASLCSHCLVSMLLSRWNNRWIHFAHIIFPTAPPCPQDHFNCSLCYLISHVSHALALASGRSALQCNVAIGIS